MVKNIRNVELCLGKVNYDVSKTKKLKRKSLFFIKDIKKGEKLTSKNIRSIRPGHGLHPKNYKKILNKLASSDVKKGTPIKWSMILKS